MADSKRVVIIGAGIAGNETARALYKTLPAGWEVVLIDRREYYFHLIGAIRAVVSPGTEGEQWASSVCVPLEHMFNNVKTKHAAPARGTVVVGEVASVAQHSLVYRDTRAEGRPERTLEFAHLVIASGSKWSLPLTPPAALAESMGRFGAYRERIAAARKIVIAGGGAVGIEFAGEVKTYFPAAQVVLVHKHELPLTAVYPAKLRKRLLGELQRMGVECVMSARLENANAVAEEFMARDPAPATLTLHGGKTVEGVDLVICSTGALRRNTEFLGEAVLVPRTGCVRTAATLQVDVPGWEHCFAVGDCADILGEVKQAAKYAAHAAVASENILRIVRRGNTDKAKLRAYTNGTEIIFISLGNKNGAAWAGVLGGVHVPRWLVVAFKSKDLMREFLLAKYRPRKAKAVA